VVLEPFGGIWSDARIVVKSGSTTPPPAVGHQIVFAGERPGRKRRKVDQPQVHVDSDIVHVAMNVKHLIGEEREPWLSSNSNDNLVSPCCERRPPPVFQPAASRIARAFAGSYG